MYLFMYFRRELTLLYITLTTRLQLGHVASSNPSINSSLVMINSSPQGCNENIQSITCYCRQWIIEKLRFHDFTVESRNNLRMDKCRGLPPRRIRSPRFLSHRGKPTFCSKFVPDFFKMNCLQTLVEISYNWVKFRRKYKFLYRPLRSESQTRTEQKYSAQLTSNFIFVARSPTKNRSVVFNQVLVVKCIESWWKYLKNVSIVVRKGHPLFSVQIFGDFCRNSMKTWSAKHTLHFPSYMFCHFYSLLALIE